MFGIIKHCSYQHFARKVLTVGISSKPNATYDVAYGKKAVKSVKERQMRKPITDG